MQERTFENLLLKVFVESWKSEDRSGFEISAVAPQSFTNHKSGHVYSLSTFNTTGDSI